MPVSPPSPNIFPVCLGVFQPTESSQPSNDAALRPALTDGDSGNDIDYFEKFTLVDVVGPGERALEEQETGQPAAEQPKAAKETTKGSLAASEDSFVIVPDVDIAGEHLDVVFYGEGAPADVPQQRECEAEGGAGMRSRRESQRSAKESGSVLFETEETTLVPIFISPGPPKIIDPILLEEPTAMSFMYSDLYEDAVGERRKSDEEHSEPESVASEKTGKRRLSDSEEADGYLEKFILKDETPTVEVPPEPVEDRREGRMMWAQSKFEMTGCLTRVAKGEDEVQRETEERKEQDITAEGRDDDPRRAKFDEHAGQTTEKQSSREKSIHEWIVGDEEVKSEVSKDQSESSESSSGQERLPGQPIGSKDEKTEREESLHTDQSRQSHGVAKIIDQGTEVPEENAGIAAEIVTAAGQDTFPGTEKENAAETSQFEEEEAAAACADVEVTSGWDAPALVEVKDKPLDEEELPSGVDIELQKPGGAEKTGRPSWVGLCEAESLEPEFLTEVEQKTEGGEERAATRPVASEEAGSSSDGKVHEPRPHPEERSGTTSAPRGKTPLIPKAQEEDSTEDNGNSVHEKTAAEDFVLLVPKGQAVEVDIEIGHFPKTATDDGQRGDPTPPLVTMETESPRSADNGTTAEPPLEVKVDDDQDQESHFWPPAPAEDAITDQEDEGVFPSLRSFIPQEDLSRVEEDIHLEAKHEDEEVETSQVGVSEERWSPEADVCGEDKEGKLKPEEEEEEAAESPDVNAEELEYEVICEQEAQELVEVEPQREAEEPEPEAEPQKGLIDLSPDEEHIEDDYEFFDAEEERQARLAAELQGLDWFCFSCGDLLSQDDRASEEHRNHEAIDVDAAYEQIKVKHDIMGWC